MKLAFVLFTSQLDTPYLKTVVASILRACPDARIFVFDDRAAPACKGCPSHVQMYQRINAAEVARSLTLRLHLLDQAARLAAAPFVCWCAPTTLIRSSAPFAKLLAIPHPMALGAPSPSPISDLPSPAQSAFSPPLLYISAVALRLLLRSHHTIEDLPQDHHAAIAALLALRPAGPILRDPALVTSAPDLGTLATDPALLITTRRAHALDISANPAEIEAIDAILRAPPAPSPAPAPSIAYTTSAPPEPAAL